jgi:hypothetical protein
LIELREMRGAAMLPETEKRTFEAILSGQANKLGLEPQEYLRKIWYHEQAAQIGEYMALTLVDELSSILGEDEEKEIEERS